MNIKLDVIKGYLRNITLSNTLEEKFQQLSIRLRSGPIEDHQEADMRDSCTLNQSFGLKIRHLIKSDPDITEEVTASYMRFSGKPDFLSLKRSRLNVALSKLFILSVYLSG